MNKIFKVIWSKARNCYVVVSELAKSHDDGHVRRSRSGCCRKAAVLAAFVLTTSLLAVPDWAQAAATNSGNPSANQAVNIENKNNTTAQGNDAYTTYDSQGNLIVGKDNQVSPIQKDPKTDNARSDKQAENVALGTRNGIGKFTHSTETKKPISGDESYAYQKLDTEWITVKVYNPNTGSYDDKKVEVYKLTPGQYMDDEYNVRAKYPERSYYSTDEDYHKAVEVYNHVATYYRQDATRRSYYTSGATAVGVDNVAEGDHSTAIGNKAKVLNSVSSYYVDGYGKLTSDKASAGYWLDEQGNITSSRQGYYASDGTFVDRYYMVPRLIDSTDAVAVGSDVTAEGRSAVAIGHESYAKEYSVAIGENSVTDYMGVAIGKDNKAKYASTAIGHTNDANGYYTATLGVNNTARADESTAIGYGNSVDGQQQNGGTTPKATYTHVLGSNNTVKGSYNAVFGDTNKVTGAYALALGGHNKISGENTNDGDGEYGIAIGYGNTVEKNALALGLNSNSIHDGSIAIGKSVNTTGDNNNGATDSIAIGTKASVHMKNGIVLGNEAYAGNNGDNNEGAIAIGHQANSAAGESIAIGTKATTGNNSGSTGMKNIGAIAIGSNTTADTVYDIAMGWGANTKNTANGGAIALGHNATIEQGGQASTAIGDSARVKENLHDAVALGSQAYADRGANNQGGYDPASNNKNHNAGSDPVWNSTLAAVSVGSSKHDVWDGSKNVHYDQQTRQITNVAAGKEDTDAVNVAQLKQVVNLVNTGGGSGTGGSGVHDYSVKSVNPGTDTNYNNGGASGDNALAAGVSASAIGAQSVAVGNNAQAIGQDSIALGTNAKADGIGATAIGQYNTALGQNSLAFGGGYNKEQKGNTASGVASVAFGEGTQAIAEGTLAFGENTQAGSTEKDKTGNPLGQNSVAFGNGTKATGGRSLAFGERTLASANDATAFGNESVASNTGATAFGNKNQATGQYATAWGGGDKMVDGTKIGTVASGTYATAFGEGTAASGESATAFGSDSVASGKDSLAFGTGSTASGDNSMAGLGGTASTANSIALGKDTKANNADGTVSVAIGENAEASGARSLAIGFGVKGKVTEGGVEKDDTNLTQTTASGESAVSIGTDTKAAGQHSIAFGSHTEATKDSSLAIGYDTHATEASAVAIGSGTKVNRGYGVAIGLSALAGIDESDPASAGASTYDGAQTVALGYYARATATNAAALGAAASANVNGAVALGYQSATTREAGNKESGTVKDAYLKPAAVDKASTWTSTAGAVSIGNANRSQTRQLTNLAAGSDDTDAVNVAQLKQVKNALDDAHLDFAGDKGNSSVKLNKKVTVTGGETNPDNLVSNEKNIGVVASQAGDDSKLELKLAKDLKGLNSVTAGNTTMETNGITIKNANNDTNKDIVIKDGNIQFGGNQVTNMGSGINSTTNTYDVDTNGANIGDVKHIADARKTTVKSSDGTVTVVDKNANDPNATSHDYDLSVDYSKAAGAVDLKYTGDNNTRGQNKLSEAVAFNGTANQIITTAANGSVTFKLADDLKTQTVTVTGKDGKDGRIGLTGKDGKDGTVTTIIRTIGKNGTDGTNGTPGVNGKDGITRIVYNDGKDGKDYTVATLDDGMKYAGNFGQGAAVKLNKTVTIRGELAKNAKETDFVDNNIAVVANQNNEDGELLIKLNKNLTGLNSSTYTSSFTGADGNPGTSTTRVDGTGLTITNGPSITNTGIDAGSKQIKNTASGRDGNMYDTKVAGHENWNNAANIGDVTNIAKDAADAVKAQSGKNITVDSNNKVNLNDHITMGDANNKAQQVDINGNAATITAGDGANKVTIDGSKGQVQVGGDDGIKIGNHEANDKNLTVYDKDGKATTQTDKAGKYITNLDNKTWNSNGSYVSGRGATEDQLHQVETNTNQKFDQVNNRIDAVDKHHTEVTVNGGTAAGTNGAYSDGNLQLAEKTGDDGQKIYDLKLNDNLNIGGAGKDGYIGINGADGKSGVGIDGKNGISIKGADGKAGVTITSKDGANGTEGHIGLTGAAGKDGKNATADIQVISGQVGVDGTDGNGGKDGMDRISYTDHNNKPHEVATTDDGMKFAGDSGEALKQKLNSTTNIKGGATGALTNGNIGVVSDGKDTLTVKLAKDIEGLNSVKATTVNATTVNSSSFNIAGDDSHDAITIKQGDVNMGGNTISGVAPGKVSQDSTDAINGSQLWQRDQAINSIGGAVNKLGSRVNRVGAGAAALAALHPLDFDPDDKWDFAAGYGNYRGANAAAVGAYYRPNEDTMFSVGGSFGGGENMVNAGVSFKLGQGNHVSTSRVAMAKEIKDLRQNVANLNAIVNRQSALIDKLTGTNAGMIKDKGNDLFPDVPANHWAYEYVTKLKHAGILTGYPDGNFDGDRMMTRYEFAAIVYRAIMAGAASNPALNQDGTLDKLANEFSSEMKYIRIDTIAKDKNGKPTIERVRVISDAK